MLINLFGTISCACLDTSGVASLRQRQAHVMLNLTNVNSVNTTPLTQVFLNCSGFDGADGHI